MTRTRRASALLVLGASLASLAWVPTAAAYVRRKTDGGIPEYWQTSCVTATVYLNGFTAAGRMTKDEVAKSVAAAAHAWSPEAVTCADGSHPYFEVAVAIDPDDRASAVVRNDAKNSVIFQTETWPATLSPEALAVTSAFAKADGRILDSDIQINATPQSFVEWANIDPNATDVSTHGHTAYDLQNAVTHEFGHFVGLDHTCFSDFTDNPPLDDLGQPIPNCGSAPIEVQLTTMWPTTDPGETHQRYLTDDDVRGVCAIYPAAQDPHTCMLDAFDDGFGCSAGGATAGRAARWLGPLAAIALAGALVTRRRVMNRRRKRCASASGR